jgi:UDP-N-acetylmuramate dehydrogenase
MKLDVEQAYSMLSSHFHDRISRDEPLAQHCAFGVGGPADIWISLETQKELTDLVNLCANYHWPLLIIGGGRNALFADQGARRIVAQMNMQHYTIELNENNELNALLVAEAGVRWSTLIENLVPLGWQGLEFGIGIPGTLGAGIVSNAGAHNQTLGQQLEWIEVLDARGSNSASEDEFAPPLKRHYEQNELDLSNRHSRFRMNRYTHIDQRGRLIFPTSNLIEPAEIALLLGFRLHRQDPQFLTEKLNQYTQSRRATEPNLPQTGPIFKDPPNMQAKALIEQVGLAGKMC